MLRPAGYVFVGRVAVVIANGYASTSLQMHNVAHDIQVSACVLPACAVMNIITVPNTSLRIEAVGGTRQLVTVGQGFQPVLVRTTDTSLPRNPVKSGGCDLHFRCISA